VRKQWKVILGIAGVLAAATAVPPAITAQDSGAVAPPKEKKVAAGEREAKKLLLLMDKDQNGKVSKQEFMGFMEAEFDRLDKDKNGELDVKELTQSQLRSRQAISR
jgi:EF hand